MAVTSLGSDIECDGDDNSDEVGEALTNSLGDGEIEDDGSSGYWVTEMATEKERVAEREPVRVAR